MVEIGSPKSTPIYLTDQHVKTLSQQLTAHVDALWRGEFYKVLDGDLAMNSASPFNTAILYLGNRKQRRTMFIKLNDLRCLAYIFPMVENQPLKYNEALPAVQGYVQSTLNSTTFIEPANANRNILYYQLYEEMKTLL
jgi:hypothetical protein